MLVTSPRQWGVYSLTLNAAIPKHPTLISVADSCEHYLGANRQRVLIWDALRFPVRHAGRLTCAQSYRSHSHRCRRCWDNPDSVGNLTHALEWEKTSLLQAQTYPVTPPPQQHQIMVLYVNLRVPHTSILIFKGWVRANALRPFRPSIDIEDTNTSTAKCEIGSKCEEGSSYLSLSVVGAQDCLFYWECNAVIWDEIWKVCKW